MNFGAERAWWFYLDLWKGRFRALAKEVKHAKS